MTRSEQGRAAALFRVALTVGLLTLVMLTAATSSVRSPYQPQDQMMIARGLADLQILGELVQEFGKRHDRFPISLQELRSEFNRAPLKDPYGGSYELSSNGSAQMFLIFLGKDRARRGVGEADVDRIVSVVRRGGGFVVE